MRLDKRTRSGPCGRGSRFALISSHTSLAVLLPVVSAVVSVVVAAVPKLPGASAEVSAPTCSAAFSTVVITSAFSSLPRPNLFNTLSTLSENHPS